ncbi:MAG: hypothetical protein ACK4MS_04170 [Paracoccaceae bacterium]
MADPLNTTTTTTSPVYTNPAQSALGTSTHTTQIRQTESSTNWFAWMLGGAVVAVGIAALFYIGNNTAPVQPAGSNNVTIEAPAAAPAPAPEAAAPVAPAPTPEPVAPAVTPVAPAPDAAPAAPAGN